MKHIRKAIILIFLIACIPGAMLSAASYYISNKGSDRNTGTDRNHPRLTFGKEQERSLIPGDSVLFMGGQKHQVNIILEGISKLLTSRRIVFSSYGEGVATIDAGDSTGFFFYNMAGITLRHLIIVGSGSHTNKGSGIVFYADDSLRHEGVTIVDIEVSGFGAHGILVSVNNERRGVFASLLMERVISHDNLLSGISTIGAFLMPGHYSLENLTIRDCRAWNNFGNSSYTENHSGNGIVCGSVRNGLIERCVAYENGKDNGCVYAGPVGIWCWASTNFTIQYCESHHNHTGTLKDGGGFDLDGGVTNSTLQYNYSHDNDGSGFLICQFAGAMEFENVTVRYNISENDGRKNETAGILFWAAASAGGIRNAYVYNNTIWLSPSKSNMACGILLDSGEMQNILISNNIICTTGKAPLVRVNTKALSSVTFLGNCYWNSDRNFRVDWGTHSYTSLSDWQKDTRQETDSGGQPAGLNLDPQLEGAGKGVTFNNPALLHTLSGYRLMPGSQALKKGLNLAREWGIDIGERDFFGNRLPQNIPCSMGAFQATK